MDHREHIPFHRPSIGSEEIAEVEAVLRSGWLTSGPRTKRFESEFAAYTGAAHALALNSCTAALHLALAALDIGPGDEVITTPLTFCATVNTILHMGATPVLADIGEDLNIDPESVAKKITSRTRAIMPVHIAGHPCDMQAIWALAEKHKLFVVEDAAHAVGTFYEGAHLGSQKQRSDAVAYSFYATKNMTTGEGGMVTTNQPKLDARMRCLALHGISKDAWNRYAENGNWYYQVLEPGFKYNMSDIQSAIGIHQLHRVEGFVAQRAELARLYRDRLSDVAELELPSDCENGRHAWHLYILRLKLTALSIDRRQFIEELRVRGIGTSVHFIPIPLHPFFAPWASEPRNDCPRAMETYQSIVSTPLYPGLTEESLVFITESIKSIVHANRTTQTFSVGAL